MKALLVGGGAREHAIADALFRSGAEIIVAMSNQNPGIIKISKEQLLCNETDVTRIYNSSWKSRLICCDGSEDPS
jgi:phosphoribosylamine--glycine ligase